MAEKTINHTITQQIKKKNEENIIRSKFEERETVLDK